MSALLETRGLTKLFGSFAAVSEVELAFEPGLIHAVLGENGAGKSTLMKLLFGLHQPSAGEIRLGGERVRWRNSMDAIRHGLGMVQQHFSLVESLSAIDNIMLGAEVCSPALGRLNRAAAIAKLEKLLPSASLSVPWHDPVRTMTVGQKQRIEILKLLFRESKILFLDEPTAVLAPTEIDDFFDVLRQLKAQGRTIVLITHKINEVVQLCDTFTVLRAGRVVSRGSPRTVPVQQIVESMIGRKLQEFEVARPAPGEVVFEATNLREVGTPARGRLDGVSLRVKSGEVVGVAGVEGSGQSSLVDAIFGLRKVEGDVRILGEKITARETRKARNLGVGLVPEDRHHQGLWLEESSYVNMAVGLEDQFVQSELFQFDRLKSTTADWAKQFDVRAASLESPVGSLSGGNQQKVIFAREVAGRKPRFLVCHQPTRGVDLGAIDLIHRKLLTLRNEGLGVLVLSSELEELFKLCDRIYVFFEGRVVAEFQRGAEGFDAFKVGAAMAGVPHAD